MKNRRQNNWLFQKINLPLNRLTRKRCCFNEIRRKVVQDKEATIKSLFSTDFGSSYGELFQSTLTDRRIKTITLSDRSGIVEWYSTPTGLVRNEIRYIKNDHSQVIVKMPSTDLQVELPDVKSGSSFEFRTLFIPEEASIDTFATAWKVHEVSFPKEYKYDRSSWEVTSVSDSSTSEGGGAATILDGNMSTYWQSAYEGGDAPLPHWAVIDMKAIRQISKVELHRRSANKDTKGVEVYISDQPDASVNDWLNIGSVEFGEASSISLTIPESLGKIEGRYLKLLLPDSNRQPYTNIVEVYVFGK